MIPPSMEVIFLILSGVILVAGVLYWFWSHLQLTQKKVKLLENAVFELREKKVPGLAPAPAPASASAPVPVEANGGSGTQVYADLADDDDWADAPEIVSHVSTPLENLGDYSSNGQNPDLQPGGRIEVPAAASQPEEEFRELFVGQDGGVVTSATSAAAAATGSGPRTPESLESMPVKELRRLAEQRGISGAEGMRKKEILAALRQQITSVPAAAAASETAATVVVERTLDIVEETDIGDTIANNEVPTLD